MTLITQAELVGWAERLSGDRSDTPPVWLTANALFLQGAFGATQLSNFGVIQTDDTAAFESVLLRAQIGELMLFSILKSPHSLLFDPEFRLAQDAVIVGQVGIGELQLVGARATQSMPVGRTGFMSSLAPSRVEHLGLSETTGVALSVSALAAVSDVLAPGVGLLPDTALARATGSLFGRVLIEWLTTPEHTRLEEETTESLLIAHLRAILRQSRNHLGNPDRAADVRAAATRVIDQRHRNHELSVADVARELHISTRQLYRVFDGEAESVRAVLLQRRLETARAALALIPAQSVESVAIGSGFVSGDALRKALHRATGSAPRDFRDAGHMAPNVSDNLRLSDEQLG